MINDEIKKIPRVIHYCWFGGTSYPPLFERCMASWKKHCPGWELHEWNESNFDIDICAYVKEAYEAKKWAFVSDYVRLWALVTHGGIYMDTDCELIKPIDEFLFHEAVSGFETATHIQTAFMCSTKGFPLFDELLDRYNNRRFIFGDGSYDLTTNVQDITKTCLNRGFIPNGKKQTIENLVIYPREFFSPKKQCTGEMVALTENTHAIHHFNVSWLSDRIIYIFGCGKYGQMWLNSYQILGSSAYIMGFLDSDKSKHGLKICGLPVYSPDILYQVAFDHIIVANEDTKQSEEMMNTLKNMCKNFYDKAIVFSAKEREKILKYFRTYK